MKIYIPHIPKYVFQSENDISIKEIEIAFESAESYILLDRTRIKKSEHVFTKKEDARQYIETFFKRKIQNLQKEIEQANRILERSHENLF